jgi:TetR/AcrR family transcriptional regulator
MAQRKETPVALGKQSTSRGALTRRDIIVAAEAIFAEQGFTAGRLTDIAARVVIQRPSIVYHFRDKRELYETVLSGLFGSLLGRIQRVLASGKPLENRIEDVVSAWVRFVGERPAAARILLREAADASSERSPVVAQYVEPIIHGIHNAIREGQRQGIFLPIDPFHFTLAVAGATIFFVAGKPTLAPAWPFNPLEPEQLRAHEAELLQATRRWLGTDALRALKTKRSAEA